MRILLSVLECNLQVVKSPNKQDDTGVMLTKPARLDIVDIAEDAVSTSCKRTPVHFVCIFDGMCVVRTKILPYIHLSNARM